MKFVKKIWTALHKSEIKILTALISILLALSVVAFLSQRFSDRVSGSSAAVETAHENKFDIQEILSITNDLEIRANSYVISGNEKYIEPSNKAIGIIFKDIAHLRSSFIDKPTQMKLINRLEELIDKKISNISRVVELRRERGLDEAFLFISKGDGNILTDDIKSITTDLMNKEEQFLNIKSNENHSNFKEFNLTFNLLLLKIAISILSVFFVLRFYFNRHRKSEFELAENKQLLQTILDTNSPSVCVKDIAGKYLMINRQFERLFQVKRENVQGKTDAELFSKEVADSIRKTDLEVISAKKQVQYKEEISVNGETHQYFSIKFPLLDKNHEVYAVCANTSDITEISRMEKKRSQEISDLFNNAPCGYMSSDKNGIITEMNDTELKWLGYKREEIIGKISVKDLLTEDSVGVFTFYFPKLQSGEIKSLHDIEIRFKRKDGSFFPALVNTIGVYDANGNFEQTRTSIFDITIMKKAEALFKQN